MTVDEGIEQAKALVKTHNHEAAFVLIDDLFRDHGEQPELWAIRAYVAANKRDYEAAEHAMGRAIHLEQWQPEYFFTRGRYRLKSERFTEAVDDFTRTIELCDHHRSDYYRESAHFLRAEAYLALGMTDRARVDCEHVRDETTLWVDSVRSKKDILEDCDRKDQAALSE